jgi:magnesium-transporting ATPase (P-type)
VERKPIQVKYQTLVVLWIALLFSQAMFLVLVWFVKPELFAAGPSRTARDGFSIAFLHDMPLVTVVFAAIAIIFLLLSFVLSRQHMRRAVEDQDAGCVQTGLILGCALSEVPSLLGLLLAFAFDHPFFYLWIALGIFGILLHFPRKGNLDAATYRSI